MSAFKYEWRVPQKVSADVAAEEFSRIQERDGGITAESLMEESRPDGAVMHPCYTWDDAKAAEKWRLNESRNLLGGLIKVRIIDESDDKPKELSVRAFSSIANPELKPCGFASKQVYKKTEDILKIPEEREQLLSTARAELRSFQRKYSELCELAGIITAIDSYLGGN